MEWIKLESTTPDKPEVLKVARILGIDRDAVLGKLIRLWRWFDANSIDGIVDAVVDADVDAVVSHAGFCAALKVVGWYASDEKNERVTLPNFSHHNGETAKKRAEKARRQAKWRAGRVGAPVDARAPTTASTREEKRREEKSKKKTPLPPLEFPPALDSESCRNALTEWLAHRERIGKRYKSQASIGKLLAEWAAKGPAAFVAAVEFSIAREYQGLFAPNERNGQQPKPQASIYDPHAVGSF